MDKLEPIIKHKFWILLALVVPLTAYGYYSANSGLKNDTKDRVDKINGLFGQIPSGNEANPRWAEGMSDINKKYEESVNTEILNVWERQQARMIWPDGMKKYLPEKYRDPFDSNAGFIYATEYPELMRQLYASIDPVVVSPQGTITGGKVLFKEDLIPRATFTNRLSIPSEMIWDAQEDIWFLRLLFDAIRNVNQASENAAKSAVRAVLKVELWGGNGESAVRGSAMGGGTGDAAIAADSDGGLGYGGGMGGVGEGMSLLGGGQTVTVAFNAEEEFGTGGRPVNSKAGGMPMGYPGMETPDTMSLGGISDEDAVGSVAAVQTLRYVKDSDTSPFAERGFYLSVLIDQRKVADFLVELSNSDWPMRIGRCQWGPNPFAGKGLPAGGGNPMMAYGGMAGYGGYGEDAEGSTMEMMSMAAGNPFEDGGISEMSGGIGAAPMLNPTGESVGLLQQFDLIQMDFVGYITFYKPPPPEIVAAVQQASQQATPAAAPSPAAAPADTTTTSAEGTTESPAAGESSATPADGSPSAPQPAADPSATAPAESEGAPPSPPAPAGDTPAASTGPATTEQPAGTP